MLRSYDVYRYDVSVLSHEKHLLHEHWGGFGSRQKVAEQEEQLVCPLFLHELTRLVH